MEVTFDNKANVLNAKLHANHDSSVIYSIATDQSLFGRTYTYVRDTNPAAVLGGHASSSSGPVIVGVVNWKKKTFEVGGVRRRVDDVRRRPGGFRNKSRFWKWGDGHEEYDIVHKEDGWEVTCTSTGQVEGTFLVPRRPQLFGKQTPVTLKLSRAALAKDEVFLLLALIYSETKRQEKTNSAGGW